MTLKKSTIISKHSDKPKSEKSRHYVDNESFYNALLQRRELINSLPSDSDKPRISEYIGECVLAIAKNLANKRNFTRYKFKEEMIQDAVLVCIRYLDNFDPYKYKNPFGYFTQICNFAFLSRIDSEKTHLYVKFKSSINASVFGDTFENDETVTDNAEHLLDNLASGELTNEYMSTFIQEYESKRAKKKKEKVIESGYLSSFMGDEDGE